MNAYFDQANQDISNSEAVYIDSHHSGEYEAKPEVPSFPTIPVDQEAAEGTTLNVSSTDGREGEEDLTKNAAADQTDRVSDSLQDDTSISEEFLSADGVLGNEDRVPDMEPADAKGVSDTAVDGSVAVQDGIETGDLQVGDNEQQNLVGGDTSNKHDYADENHEADGAKRPVCLVERCKPHMVGPLASQHYGDALFYLRGAAAGRTVILSRGGSLSNRLRYDDSGIVVVHPDQGLIDYQQSQPLGTKALVAEAERTGTLPQLNKRGLPTRPMVVEYINAHPESTGLADAFSGKVIVEQAHLHNSAVLAEAQRIAKPDAPIVLMGYQQLHVEGEDAGTINKIIDAFWDQLEPYRSEGERQLQHGFRDIDLPLENDEYWGLNPTHVMRAKWTASELLEYMLIWPAVKAFQASLEGFTATCNIRNNLPLAWGTSKTRREIVWPVQTRIGFKAA